MHCIATRTWDESGMHRRKASTIIDQNNKMSSRTQQVTSLVTSLLDRHGLHQQGWGFKVDNSVSRAGCCHFSKRLISLSKHLVTDEKHAMADVENITLHEIAHALAGPLAGHGREWKAIAVRIGCDGNRCHSLELKPHTQQVSCVLCGHLNAVRHRVARDYWGAQHCSACGILGTLTIVTTRTPQPRHW